METSENLEKALEIADKNADHQQLKTRAEIMLANLKQ